MLLAYIFDFACFYLLRKSCANTAWFSRDAPANDARHTLNELHAELAKLSTNSRHRVIEGATHGSLIHNQKDAQATIAAVEAVLTAIQTGQPLTP
jgi:hypothetical protein